uniref:Kinesin family member 13A n=1 Tax=Oncorhynchus mykiss TaxID=8022 RepID=A0A8K9UN37_ONCMY
TLSLSLSVSVSVSLSHRQQTSDFVIVSVGVFAFDHCFWSMDESNMPKYAGQEVVFQCLGEGILENAFQGYNACIFAYGQTGSGKSFSMMGNKKAPGLIPRLCCSLFERIGREDSQVLSFKVEVSYMEIYNEKVRDLLDPKGSRQSLKVREHKVLGPYVDGLSQLAVTNFEDIEVLMSEGNKSRTVAATNMNEESSRSHAVFSIIVTQTLYDLKSGNSGEKVSKMSLVDLAGSERVSKTGAAGERLKEGSNINRSLTTLGCVISALADQSAGKGGKNKFVPYRDSVLTWLLKDNLGGNSKTCMIATVSPAADNYEETLSTLRYADRAKRIVNHAVVNEDPNARIIRELREEVEKLRVQLSQAESLKAPELKERLQESEKLIQEMTVTWEQKLRNTEEIATERQQQLESMGISLETSGIKVGDDKCFLVNLNADPALNELLVYYLKEHTRVGADTSQDIQLFGIGIQSEHCVLEISPDGGEVTLTPIENARTCVNGTMTVSLVHLWHGDRILWGNNHFFRINLPGRKRRERLKELERERASPRESYVEVDVETGSEASSEQDYSYEFAQTEVMMKTLGNNDPMQNVVQVLEKQYLEEKRTALEEQRMMYERELESLRQQLSPERTNQHQRSSSDRLTFPTHTPSHHSKIRPWTEERDELFRQSLSRLREQVVKANTLVREANFLAKEMNKLTDYQVTLQIPAANLSANRKRGAIVSEPAILVRWKGKGTQVWTIDKLDNKLVDMRDHYRDWKEGAEDTQHSESFYEAQENHNLIGVANVFLECLFHDIRLQYAVPIISQQGEVAGRLHVELMRVSGAVPDRLEGGDDSSENSSESSIYDVMDTQGEMVHMARKLTCRATGLPLNLSNFVFCQYTFWEGAEPTVAPPMVSPDTPTTPRTPDAQFTVRFDHCKEYVVHVTEEFLEFIADGALAIEVWGHRCAGNGRSPWELDALLAKTRTLRDRWSEVSRRIELWVSIQELNEQGDYSDVEMHPGKDIGTGGVFQLRQGHSRRLQVCVKQVQDSGTLPLLVETVLSVSIGCVSARSTKLQRALDSYQEDGDMDSYQEEDLNCVRDRWSEALIKRREYLDEQINKIINKQEKSEEDMEREARLVEQWVGLTEERNAVLVPAPGSGIPGAPAHWAPSAGMEAHFPVLFLDLNGNALCSWDSSIHDSVHLNRVTSPNERIYVIIKATVQLSHPVSMELVLRKRISVNIYNKQSFTQSLKRRMSLKNTLYSCGVTYEILSNIPKASEEPEERETLALMAARGDGEESQDGQTYIEQYTRGLLEVENILSLERLRQVPLTHTPHTHTSHTHTSRTLHKHTHFTHTLHTHFTYFTHTHTIHTLHKHTLHTHYTNTHTLFTHTHTLHAVESYYMALSLGLGPQDFHSFQSYIPEDFANFEVYNAALESQEGGTGGRGELRGVRGHGGGGEREGAPRSPTASSCTSGYFSHSASDATLSDVPFGSPSFHCTSTARGCVQTRSVSPWGDTQTPAFPPGVPSQPLPTTSPSSPVSIPNCSEQPPSPSSPVSIPNCSEQPPSPQPRRCVLSVSQEFTDFKGADDGMEDLGELGHFQSGDAPHISPVPAEEEKGGSGSRHQTSDKDLGDLPPGSPCPSPCCPSPNPSSTEASGDSCSGDEGSGSPVAQLPDWMAPGEQVWVGKRSGTVHYVGGVEFAKGIWVGVQLDLAVGKHNGTVQGRVYFRCPPGHGVFVKPSCLTRGPPSMDTTDPQPLVR